MSATPTGLIVIENARPVEGSRCVILNAQIYVSPDQALTGRFHFFNTAGIRFDDVGHYLGTLSAWAHGPEILQYGALQEASFGAGSSRTTSPQTLKFLAMS